MTALVYDTSPVRWTACKIAGWIRPSVFWSKIGGLQLRQVPRPRLPGPEWVRLRPILGGICGTDIAAVTQRHHPANILQAFASLPAVLGHENVAVVEEVGPAVGGWRGGERVVVEPTLSCVPRGIQPLCAPCAAGRFTLCESFREGGLPPGSMIGWNSFTGGSWSESFVAHQSQLHLVPEGLSDEAALLTDPLAGGLHAVLRYRPPTGSRVLVLGGGLLGLAVVASLKALDVDCRTWAAVRHESQARLMRRFGADEVILLPKEGGQATRYAAIAKAVGGQVVPSKFGHQAFIGGVDVVYDCIGSGASLTDAMKYAGPGATVVEVGTSQIALVDTCPRWFDELHLVGANGRAIEAFEGRRLHTYEVAFELMARGRLAVDGLVTHRFPLERYK